MCVQDKNIERGTYSELLSKWLQSKLIAVKESTFSRYSRIVDVYIIPYLGDLYVSEFSTAIIEQFTHNLLTSGKKDGSGGLSSKTVSDILVVIKSSLEYGHENGYSVNCNAKRILIKKHDKEMRVLTPAEQIKFVSYLREDMDLYKFGTLLSLYTGIRIGELCALRWENIQSDINAIIIRETLQRIPSVEEKSKTKIIITEPKSECSVREIPLPDCLHTLIAKFRSSPKSYLLTGDKERYAEPRTMQYHFKQYIKKSGIPSANYHSLRHTFATRCIEAGFDVKSLSEILGHSNVNITLNRYVHSSFELKAKNMNKLTF